MAERGRGADQSLVEGWAGGTPCEVGLQGRSLTRFQVAIDVAGHLLACVPATERHAGIGLVSPLSLRESAHEHHPPSSDPLLGGRKRNPEEVSNLVRRPTLGVMEHNGAAVVLGEVNERVAQLCCRFGSLHHSLRIDAIGLVTPACFDIAGTEFVSMPPSSVDREVVEDLVEPGAERCLRPILPSTLKGP